eukprot:m.90755 g.90755  ORF g.90755 m.90755 type:complete len:83 (-) comp14604_c1_seq5:1345-1593(-)
MNYHSSENAGDNNQKKKIKTKKTIKKIQTCMQDAISNPERSREEVDQETAYVQRTGRALQEEGISSHARKCAKCAQSVINHF